VSWKKSSSSPAPSLSRSSSRICPAAAAAPPIRDLVFIGFSLLVAAIQAGSVSGGHGWSARWFILALGIASSVALWWRHQYPVAVTVFTVLGMALGQILVPMGLALLTLAIRRRDLALAVLSIAAYAAYVVNSWIDNGHLWVLLFTGPFLVGSWVAAGAHIAARRDLMVSLRDRAERAEAERELRADQARLGERAWIAQETYDVLAHKVSLIALHARGLEVNPAVRR
jgi:signal transduction histidine kinase